MSTAAAAHKEAVKQAKNLSVPEQILKSISQVFQDAQSTYVGHRKHLTVLKTIQKRAFDLGFEDVFNIAFCKLVNKVLPVKKAETVADRIVKLVANFVASIQSDEESKEYDEDEEEPDTLGSRFVNHFVHHLLRGIESRDKNVRYRVMHFLSLIMNGLGEIDEKLYSTLIWEIHKRLFDKESSVRIKAVLCLSRFQEEDVNLDDPNSAVAKLLFAIQNDLSAEVRRAALLNLDKTEATLPYLMERAKDVNSINRKLVYSRIVKEIGDFRLLNRTVREKILTWGLKDREPAVQQATIKMFCNQWYDNVNQDIMELLERLHLTESEIAEVALKFFLQNRSDVLAKIQFDEDFWRKLNVEASFLARMFHTHCIVEDMNDAIDNNFPETTEFASLLTKYLRVRKQTKEEAADGSESVTEINFVIQQLLLIAKNYDFGDEVGRREMLQALRMSFYDNLTDSQIKVALEVLKKISINEKDFCQMVSEIIIDIRDDDEEFTMDMDMDLDTESEEQAAIYKTKINRAIQCLSICQHMLELTHEPLRDNIPVTSLLDSVINPSIRSKILPIREGGVKCLGLCCLLDDTLATEQLAFFGICCAKGNEDLQATCLKIIFDILCIHGPKVLDVEGCVDTLSMHKLLFRSLRKAERPRVQAITAEGLCKLYLNDIFNDEELFETLLLAYFSAGNSQNEDLLQALSFCLPAYAFSHPKHQEKLALVAADAFSRLYAAYEQFTESEDGSDATMSSPSTILQQLIYWTDPLNLVNCPDETKLSLAHHYTFVLNIMDLLGSENQTKAFKKAISTNLAKFVISDELPYADLDTLHQKAMLAKDEIELSACDAATMNAINRFISNLDVICNTAEERENNKSNEKENDEEFVHALIGNDSNDNKEEQLEADFGEADEENLAIPETSLRKIASNQSFAADGPASDNDDASGKEYENILGDEVYQSANNMSMVQDDCGNDHEKSVFKDENGPFREDSSIKGETLHKTSNNSSLVKQAEDVDVGPMSKDNTNNSEDDSSIIKSNRRSERMNQAATVKPKSSKLKKSSKNNKKAAASKIHNDNESDNSVVYFDSDDDKDRIFKKPTLRARNKRSNQSKLTNEESSSDEESNGEQESSVTDDFTNGDDDESELTASQIDIDGDTSMD